MEMWKFFLGRIHLLTGTTKGNMASKSAEDSCWWKLDSRQGGMCLSQGERKKKKKKNTKKKKDETTK